MDYVSIGIGLLLIGSGFLVKKYPSLIAGYNTMSEEQQKNVDIEGLSTLMRNSLIFMGLLVAVLPYIFTFFGMKSLADSSILIGMFGVLPFLLIRAQKYDHNSSKKKKQVLAVLFILLGVGIFVAVLISTGLKPPQVELYDSVISISGMYGVTEEINQIDLLPSIPKIERKTNGFNFGEVRKGNFDLEDLGSCKLFLQSDQGPYMLIRTTSQIPVILNRELPVETKALYERMKISLE